MPLTQEQVLSALRGIKDPELFKDIVTLNLVKGVQIDGDHVTVRVQPTSAASPLAQTLKADVEAALKRAGAARVTVETPAPARPLQQPPGNAPAGNALPQIKHVVAVGAGKGGVGKSTLAVNIAVALQRSGHKVGLMDGDIYGPSMPTMLGIKGLPPDVRASKIQPFHVHGIFAITIGALVDINKPLIWRGPMAHGAFKQLLLDNTEWPELDYLIVDLPPGTGDVPLTLCQLLRVTGAVVVATPQQVALDDAVRAVGMFQQLGTPVLGLVENMSYIPLPNGEILDMFGRGGTERAAKELNLPFLGDLPMFQELRVNSDSGKPHANFDNSPALRGALERIATRLDEEVTKRSAVAAPTLTIS